MLYCGVNCLKVVACRSKLLVKYALGLLCCVICWWFLVLSGPPNDVGRTSRISALDSLLLEIPSATGDNGRCLLQKYDLYDPSIMQYVSEEPYKLDCSNKQPYLTYMDSEGNLFLNRTELERDVYSSVRCTYEPVIRRSDDEFQVHYGDPKPITKSPTKINESVVRVRCHRFDSEIYVTVHSWIRDPPDYILEKNKYLHRSRPSVLILVIDSMSRGQFLRALPKTFSLLNELGIVVLEGLNKVGDNTYRNMLPMLTGMRYDEDMIHVPNIPQRKFLPKESKVVKFDDDPIIWKLFQQQGYITMYGEEYLTPTFNFGDYKREFEGFVNEPVDYYFRPYYVSLTENSWSILNALSFRRRYCIGNEPSYRYLLNYTEEFITKMADTKYFALPFFVEHSHEYLNDIKNMDDDLHSTLQRLFKRGYLKNTVVVVMGDHGHRFSGIRSTPIGLLEERMPFFGVIVPEPLLDKHPHLKVNLISNKDVLLSWFDIHATLLDILYDDFSALSTRKRQEHEIGLSAFRPIPSNRTCISIGIPQVYCTCGVEKNINIESALVRNGANALVSYLNELVSAEDNITYIDRDPRRCVALNLSEINSASLMASWQNSEQRTIPFNIRIRITTTPGGAKFEGALRYNGENEEMSVIGDVNRVNTYGNQSSCVRSTTLKLYCYCL